MRRRSMVVLACCGLAGTAGCEDAGAVRVQPLPPLERPSPEARAGLPEVAGVWRFAGFEIAPGDTALVRSRAYPMTPPGDLAIETQRLDSIAGRYLREGAAFPFSGEVRRDGSFALVAFAAGEGSFAAGRVRDDTLWVELTSFGVASGWPRGARAGLVRRPGGEPFLRLLGGAAIGVPVDSAALADSVRRDAPGAVRPGIGEGAAPAPGQAAPVPQQPQQERPAQPQPQPQLQPQQPRPQPQQPPQQAPQPQPQRPAPAERPRTDPRPAPRQPAPDTPRRPETPPPTVVEPPPAPRPEGPRDTLRFGDPPA